MEPWELDPLLLQLRRGTGSTVHRILHDLQRISQELWCDERHCALIRATCVSAGLEPPALSGGAPLGVGEAWLLLYDASSGCGEVARVRSDPQGDTDLDFETAYRGLRAMCGRMSRSFPQLDSPLAFRRWPKKTAVTGRSLGLAACAALLSRHLSTTPRIDTAASAEVDNCGQLRKVEHLPQKIKALVEAHPEVRRVVVAMDQDSAEVSGLELVRCARLEDALREVGLDPGHMGDAGLGDHLARVKGFEATGHGQKDSREWLELSRDAWESMHALLEVEPRAAAQAAGHAALFALHAGDGSLASKACDVVRPYREEIPEDVRAWLAIVEATHRIDAEMVAGNPDAAVASARQARDLCPPLASNREVLFGMALGTYGRAHMHAGRPAEAEPLLRQAYEHHRLHDGRAVARGEKSRSACYLATCLRLLNRAQEALGLVDEEIEHCRRLDALPLPHETLPFLCVERGRCLLALDRPTDALSALRPVVESPTDYPKVAAIRGTAEAYRRLGNDREAWKAMQACIGIAERSNSDLLVRVSLLAVGDALLEERHPERLQELRPRWTKTFGTDDAEAVRRELARWVY